MVKRNARGFGEDLEDSNPIDSDPAVGVGESKRRLRKEERQERISELRSRIGDLLGELWENKIMEEDGELDDDELESFREDDEELKAELEECQREYKKLTGRLPKNLTLEYLDEE